MMIRTVIAMELEIKWNNLEGLRGFSTTGQIVPLTIGQCFTMFRALCLVYLKFLKRQPTGITLTELARKLQDRKALELKALEEAISQLEKKLADVEASRMKALETEAQELDDTQKGELAKLDINATGLEKSLAEIKVLRRKELEDKVAKLPVDEKKDSELLKLTAELKERVEKTLAAKKDELQKAKGGV
jgi:hypothetical protein